MSAPTLGAQIPRFVAIGALASGTHYAIYLSLVSVRILPPVPATAVGIAFGTVFSYTLNSRYTFRRASSLKSFLRFWTVTALGAGLNASLVALGVRAGWSPALAGLLAILAAATFNFAAHRIWTFRI